MSTADAVAEALRKGPLSALGCARIAGVSTTTARRHLKALVASGQARETTISQSHKRGAPYASVFSWKPTEG